MDKLIKRSAIAKYGKAGKEMTAYKRGGEDVMGLVAEALADAVYKHIITPEECIKISNLIQDYSTKKDLL